MRFTWDAIRVRALPVLPVAVAAMASWLARPSPGTAAAGITAMIAACAGVLWPSGLAPMITLLALATEFTAAAKHVSGPALLGWTPAEAAVLWLVHMLFGVAAATPAAGSLHRPGAVRQTLARTAASLAVVVPVGFLVMLVAAGTPVEAPLRALGAMAAIAAAVLPVYLLRGRTRTGGTSRAR